MRERALTRHRLTWLLPVLVVLGAVAGCSDSREEQVRLTYFKHDGSERRMRQDEQELRATRGVVNVLPTIDSSNLITIEVFLLQSDQNPGEQKALDLGYTQARN